MKLNSFMYFYPERPKLMHIEQGLFEILSKDPDWIAELKRNGSRLQLHCLNGGFQFWNRHEAQLSYTPTPEITAQLQSLNLQGYTLFDGELRHNKTIGIKNQIMIFDVFIFNGKLLVGVPFHDRRKILEDLFKVNGSPMHLAEQYHIGFKKLFHDVIEDPEIEGLVLKNINGMLQLGRRNAVDSKWMFKVRKPSGRYKF